MIAIETRHGGFVHVARTQLELDKGHRLEFGVTEVRMCYQGDVLMRKHMGKLPKEHTIMELIDLLNELDVRASVRNGGLHVVSTCYN